MNIPYHLSNPYCSIHATENYISEQELDLYRLQPDVSFVPEHCSFPTVLVVGQEDDTAQLRIINTGDSGDVLLVVEVKDEIGIVWEGYIENNTGVDLYLTVYLPPEHWPKSEYVTFKFMCGYPGSEPDTMIVTDSISFTVYVDALEGEDEEEFNWMNIAIIGGVVAIGVGVLLLTMPSGKQQQQYHPPSYQQPYYPPQYPPPRGY